MTPTPAPRPDDPCAQLDAILREAGVKVAIGLRAQGKFDTVTEMLRHGRKWDEIGTAIGWSPDAAQRWYQIESHVIAIERAAVEAFAAKVEQRARDAWQAGGFVSFSMADLIHGAFYTELAALRATDTGDQT